MILKVLLAAKHLLICATIPSNSLAWRCLASESGEGCLVEYHRLVENSATRDPRATKPHPLISFTAGLGGRSGTSGQSCL